LSQRARSYLETIQHAIEDVAATVARMREFYRQREPQSEMTPVSINRLIQQVLDLTRVRWNDMPQQRGSMVRLATEFAFDLPAISGIENEIRDALTNLILNAADSMPGDGTLTLRTRLVERPAAEEGGARQEYVYAEVADSGVGMDEDTRRRCLEPFFTTKGERGTGLGLAMVYGMVKRHNGEIEIESAPGSGTTVRLIFPVPGKAAPISTAAFAPAAPVAGLRLLIVDDDPLLIKSLQDTMEGAGHTIVPADGGQAGIEAFHAALARDEPFSAVITDLGMPYVDGRRVAAAVKGASPSTPVILLTGWGQRLITEGEIPPNVDRVLSKPPKLRELNEALASLTANHA
jgi:CheY-like chemotaxis protein